LAVVWQTRNAAESSESSSLDRFFVQVDFFFDGFPWLGHNPRLGRENWVREILMRFEEAEAELNHPAFFTGGRQGTALHQVRRRKMARTPFCEVLGMDGREV